MMSADSNIATSRFGSMRYGTIIFPARAVNAAIPGATLATFEQGSHGFNVEQADKFNRAVLGIK